MEPKVIFGILINLIFWPLIIHWIFSSRRTERELRRRQEEYNKPENKFKREIASLGLSLNHFSNSTKYPYIKEALFYFRQNYKRAALLDDDELPYFDKAMRGASEKILYNKLISSFGEGKIKTGSYSVGGFFPDIIYIDDEKKTFVDIEIDEPYSYKTKQPIHYSGIDTNGRKVEDCNKERDDVFTKNGWTVVRFSEDQVINQADECVKIIDYVVCYLSARNPYFDLTKSCIATHKRWTKQEASVMAISNHRGY